MDAAGLALRKGPPQSGFATQLPQIIYLAQLRRRGRVPGGHELARIGASARFVVAAAFVAVPDAAPGLQFATQLAQIVYLAQLRRSAPGG